MKTIFPLKFHQVDCFLGFEQGQYGDLFMCLTPCRVIKRLYPNSRLIFLVNKKYQDCAELFHLSDDIDDIVITDGYKDKFPTESDQLALRNVIGNSSSLLFPPTPINTIPDWFNYWHQTEELCRMYRLPQPTEEEMNFSLRRPSVELGDYVCITPISSDDYKSLSPSQIDTIKKICLSLKLRLVHLASPSCPVIDGVERFSGTYAESVLKMLGSKFLITVDTGMAWAASAFKHNTFGIYFREYNKMSIKMPYTPSNNTSDAPSFSIQPKSCINIVPKNPNMQHVEFFNKDNLDESTLLTQLTNYAQRNI